MQCLRCPNESRPNLTLCQHCADLRKEAHNRWRKTRREIVNAKQRLYLRSMREKVLTKYGSACVCCNETFLPYLEIDHINGNGKQDRGNTGLFYLACLNTDRDDIQILCANCHSAKTYKVECPPHT